MPANDLTLVGVYSKPGRDPRGWAITAAFKALVNPDEVKPIAADDAADAKWFTIKEEGGKISFAADEIVLSLEDLAFDHCDIITDALKKD